MKIPLVYPKIPDGTNCPLKQCAVYEKYDGTNLHWVWTPEFGWTDFGTRRNRFSLDSKGIAEFEVEHPSLREAPVIFLRAFSSIVNNPPHKIILFTEFLGENSFAGNHLYSDKKRLILFDAMVNGKMLEPKQFSDAFATYNPPEEFDDEFDVPRIIYTGKYTGQLVEDVRRGKYPVNEGVVIKGVVDGQVYMTKVKTNAYMNKLKLQFKDNWQDYWE